MPYVPLAIANSSKTGGLDSACTYECWQTNKHTPDFIILIFFFSFQHQPVPRSNMRLMPGTSCGSTGEDARMFSLDTREQLVLFTKLFLIMGLSWFSECIHIELHGDHTNMKNCNFYVEVFLRILGGLNMIRGFFIFLVFICKPKIWNLVQKRHPKLWSFLKCCR